MAKFGAGGKPTDYLDGPDKAELAQAEAELKKDNLVPEYRAAVLAIRKDLLSKAERMKERADLIASAPPARPFYRRQMRRR